MKKGFVIVLLALVLTVFAIVPVFADGDYTIAVVPKPCISRPVIRS